MYSEQFEGFIYFVSFNALLVSILALNISRLRITLKIPYGDGDNITMKQAIRAHANGVEHVTIFALIVLALSLLSGTSSVLFISIFCFSVSRVIHAFGMLQRHFNARRLGALLTYLSEGFCMIYLPVQILAV